MLQWKCDPINAVATEDDSLALLFILGFMFYHNGLFHRINCRTYMQHSHGSLAFQPRRERSMG